MNLPECQLHGWARIHEPLKLPEKLWQRRNRLRRMLGRRRRYLYNLFSEIFEFHGESSNIRPLPLHGIERGDFVRVRSKKEIRGTLNWWNQTKGCAFTEEMWEYCGTVHCVFKRVDYFLDERDMGLKRCKRLVLLEGVHCKGTRDFGECDRNCFFFWRDEWLERVSS